MLGGGDVPPLEDERPNDLATRLDSRNILSIVKGRGDLSRVPLAGVTVIGMEALHTLTPPKPCCSRLSGGCGFVPLEEGRLSAFKRRSGSSDNFFMAKRRGGVLGSVSVEVWLSVWG